MSLSLRGALVCAVLAALAPATARANFFPGTPILGPTSDLVSVGDVTVSRAGEGGVVALVKDGGVAHVFVSPLTNGQFGALARVDGSIATAASEPVMSSADGGRQLVAWVTAGQVMVSVKLSDQVGFSAPQALGMGSDPATDMSLNGAAYVSWTGPGGGTADVRAARLPRGEATTALDVLPDPLDVDPTQAAGLGTGRSRVAASADGTAVVTWGEGATDVSHVYARRLFDETPSQDPQDLTEAAVAGHNSTGPADLPDIDIEDDSSFAWIVFRQRFDDGHLHLVARRLVGSQFEDPTFVDGLGYPAGSDVSEDVIQENGMGEGMAVSAGPGGVFSSVLHDNLFNPGVAVGSAATPSAPSAGIGENGLGTIAWLAADGMAHARSYKYIEASRDVPTPLPDVVISDPQYGAVAPQYGMDMEIDRAGDAAAVFAQQTTDGVRLVGAYFDRPPGSFYGQTTTKPRKTSQPTLSWGSAFELWGPITYQVTVDAKPVGAPTTATKLQIPAIPDGRHTWGVVATDERGQTTATPARTLITDATKPTVTFKVSRVKGGLVKVLATARDGVGGSGIARVRIDFGDGAVVTASSASHHYAKKGRKTIRVSATDKAGNAIAVTRSVKF